MRYARLAFRTLPRLELTSSRGISYMSVALWLLHKKMFGYLAIIEWEWSSIFRIETMSSSVWPLLMRSYPNISEHYPILVYTTQVNITFRARWLASSEVISQVLFTYEQPKKNNGFCCYIFTNKVTLWVASSSACVVYTKINNYSPHRWEWWWIIVICYLLFIPNISPFLIG